MLKIIYTNPKTGALCVVHPASWARLTTALTIGDEKFSSETPVALDTWHVALQRANAKGIAWTAEYAETEEQFAARIMAKDVPAGVTDAKIVDEAAIPIDRTFRDAWVHGGDRPIVHMDKARAIHMGRIREARNAALKALDVDYQRADEAGDANKKKATAAQKQTLRDLPKTFDLSKAATPEALHALWPDGLGRP